MASARFVALLDDSSYSPAMPKLERAAPPRGLRALPRRKIDTIKWIWAKRRLYTYEELPPWLRAATHPYIRSGYQANLSGYAEAWAMLLQLHNETVNVLSHLLGGLFVFLPLAVRCFVRLHPAARLSDKIAFGSYCLLATKTLVSSALFHAHFHLSPKAYRTWCALDTVGISALTCGSGVLLAQYIFHDSRLRLAWVTAVVLANAAGVIGPLFSFWTAPHFRKARVAVYSSAAALSVLPILYVMATGAPPGWPSEATRWIAGSFASYACGATIYLLRIPECLLPGRFDCLGNSHQIWHILVLCGALCLFRGGYELMRYRLEA
ncbi:hemolysin-III related-domain-containing protein [Hyaloraphidium curvatum]|nr:hemolysin-III related-domain-containing protein [Hyaloraphidium curvatum]